MVFSLLVKVLSSLATVSLPSPSFNACLGMAKSSTDHAQRIELKAESLNGNSTSIWAQLLRHLVVGNSRNRLKFESVTEPSTNLGVLGMVHG